MTLQWLVRFSVPVVEPAAGGTAILAGLAGGLVVLVWWLFFSRAPWIERIGAVVLIVGALIATSRLVHESIAGGMMGMMLPILAIPVVSLALVVSAAASRRLASGPRRALMAVTLLLACGTMTIVRTGGLTGAARSDVHWRWTATPEQRLLARASAEPRALDANAAPAALGGDAAGAVASAGWPGFRGPERDGIVRGLRIETDWSRSAPIELWRRPVGPGWSSCAVHGRSIYTQEQLGDEELVSSYDLLTGAPLWSHRDAARFSESNAGAGPRGTPTVAGGRVHALGATGILNVLDARDGSVVWSRNAASDTGQSVPHWGIASSPLVLGDVLIVATAGVLAAYDVASGEPRWFGPRVGWGYSSPHLATIDGVAQIVLLNGAGAIGVAPADGALHWKHEWHGDGIVQPAVLAGGHLLIGSGSGLSTAVGVRRIAVAHGPEGWNVEVRWTSSKLKPYFSDFVVHGGHAIGFDGGMLACIDLESGGRKWKGGRYGHGQLVLLADQGVLLVLSEEGELALVRAAPDAFTELARAPALEGKTWNHPVLVGDVLLVRNAEEMAAFRLPVAESAEAEPPVR